MVSSYFLQDLGEQLFITTCIEKHYTRPLKNYDLSKIETILTL